MNAMASNQRSNQVKYEDCVISSFKQQPMENNGFTHNHKQVSLEEVTKQLDNVKWYHGPISRTTAEIVLKNNAREGAYLLRNGNQHTGFSVSVRSYSAVKHFILEYHEDDSTFVLGKVTFYSLEELLNHFKSKPVIGSETGVSDKLLYPYLVDTLEQHSGYHGIERHGLLGEEFRKKGGAQENENDPNDICVESKEGSLTKRGAIHKNWKERWFVVHKNNMQYFINRKKSSPIRSLDLKEALEVAEDFIDEKRNCFRLVFPQRTFYFVAKTPKEAKDWIDYLQWKINYYNELKKARNKPS